MTPILDTRYLEYRGLLFGVAYRMLGCAADADEVVQDCFVRWIEHPPDTSRPLRGWLLTVVLNLCRDRLRKKRSRTWLPGPILDEQATLNASPEARLGALESVGVGFLLAMEGLSPDQRAALVLRSVLGCSVEETAEILHTTPVNVRTLHHRAHRLLDPKLPTLQSRSEKNTLLLQQFLMSVAQGDIIAAAGLLAPEAVAVTDGDGHRAAYVVVTGPLRIARMCVSLSRVEGEVHFASCNGLPAILSVRTSNVGLHPVRYGDARYALTRLTVSEAGQILRVESVIGPRKLGAVMLGLGLVEMPAPQDAKAR